MAKYYGCIKNKPKERQIQEKEKKSKSAQRRRAFSERRSMRRSELGRLTEERVEKLLAKKREAGELLSFKKHLANSQEDCAGKDFTVSKIIDGKTVSASFGVTISLKNHQEDLMLHPDMPSIIIPPEMNDERIRQRIVQILVEAEEVQGGV